MQEITKTRGGTIIFQLEVEVPAAEAEAYAKAMTGNDDDVILAAEKAMRNRLADSDVDSEIELYVPESERVQDKLTRYGQEAHRL